ncbi:O-antigen ligase family protein [Methylosinus sp. 3S-1]|nr:O-antigen ligase family protein [Methylosinus sp. 3S-1]
MMMAHIVTDAAAPPSGPILNYRRLLDALLWITSFSGSVVFIEPSPYDFLILLTMVVWFLGGFTLHRGVLPGAALMILWTLGGYISLIPYWNEPDPVEFMTHTLFISMTGVFYMLFFSQDAERRFELCMSGYAASCMLAAIIAVGSWAQLFGNPQTMTLDGRAMAPFKDPNVLGSYMVPGLLFFVQRLLLGRMRYWPVTLLGLALSGAALFASFSRGSWGAGIVSVFVLTLLSMITADSRRMRLRIGAAAATATLIVSLGVAGVLATDASVREFFFKRASATQEYDEGPTGRFGNQLRSLPMLVERPNGMGPLRFRLTFGIEPHNSYVNAFASNGWLGGFAFLGLATLSLGVLLRASLQRTPFQRSAQLVAAAALVFFLQGLQIDIDHWRFFWIFVGAAWGLEAARMRWVVRTEHSGSSLRAQRSNPEPRGESFVA